VPDPILETIMIDTAPPPAYEHESSESPNTERSKTPTASVSSLLSGILDDAQKLIRQQAMMLRAEIREDGRRTLQVAEYLSIGAVFAALGALFLMIAMVYLLNWVAPSIPLWACWAILGTVDLVGGIIALVIGRNKLSKYNPLPDKTLNTIEENLTWTTTPPRM